MLRNRQECLSYWARGTDKNVCSTVIECSPDSSLELNSTMHQLQFLRALVILNGAVPLAMLLWDAWRGQLGANSVNQALHITGILSLVFLFLSLLITPLRWYTGWGGWVAFRRALGLYGFFYAVVHLVIYVGFDRALSVSSTLHEIWTRRFLQVGAVAILLMVPLAVTSTNAMIQRMGPKRWKALHRVTYLVAILGVIHYYMLVKSDVRQPLAFAGVLAVLLSSRVGRRYFDRVPAGKPRLMPVARSVSASEFKMSTASEAPVAPLPVTAPTPRTQWKGELRVGEIIQETPDVKTFRLVAEDGGPPPFEYRPGQFLNIQLTIDGKRVNRSYTLASSPSRGHCYELTIKREPLGLASAYMHDRVEVGDMLKVSGPAGKFIFTGDAAGSVLLIAGGVGITPVMSILRYLTDRAWSGDIYFLIVAKTEEDLIFRDEIRGLKQQFPRLHLCETLTRSDESTLWTGERGRLSEELLARFVPHLQQTPVYLCGPNDMMDATRQSLKQLGVPDSLVHTEAFAGKKASAGSTAMPAEEAPLPPAISPPPAIDTTSTGASRLHTIRFIRSNIPSEIDSDTTLLEAAEAASIALPYECRSGICGQCKTRVIGGTVLMDCEDALSPADKIAGLVLACQARLLTPATVDA